MALCLVSGGDKRRLSTGEFLIGRSPDCAVVLNDPLVSRHHAVLRVDESKLEIEDLNSRNGVEVNGRRITAPCQLRVNDVVGVVQHRLQLIAVAERRGDDTTARHQVSDAGMATFAVFSELANKALSMGKPQDAERIASGQLKRIREAALEHQLPWAELEEVAIFAANLAVVTSNARWLGYVFELYHSQGLLCPAHIVDRLYGCSPRAEAVDLSALDRYLLQQRARLATLNAAERFALNRAEGLRRRFTR